MQRAAGSGLILCHGGLPFPYLVLNNHMPPPHKEDASATAVEKLRHVLPDQMVQRRREAWRGRAALVRREVVAGRLDVRRVALGCAACLLAARNVAPTSS